MIAIPARVIVADQKALNPNVGLASRLIGPVVLFNELAIIVGRLLVRRREAAEVPGA